MLGSICAPVRTQLATFMVLGLTLSACGSESPSSSPSGSSFPSYLSFSGELTGSASSTQTGGLACIFGPDPDSTTRSIEFLATVDGTLYGFQIHVDHFHGPGSYQVGLNAASSLAMVVPPSFDPTYAGIRGTLTVGPNSASGVMDIDLTRGSASTTSTKVAHVTGSWRCAPTTIGSLPSP